MRVVATVRFRDLRDNEPLMILEMAVEGAKKRYRMAWSAFDDVDGQTEEMLLFVYGDGEVECSSLR